MSKKLLSVGWIVLLLTGCDQVSRSPLTVYADPDASPTKIGSKKSVGKAGLGEHAPGVFFDNAQLGHGAITNLGAPRAFVLVLWNAKDRVNQIFLNRSLDAALGTGEKGDFFVPLADDRAHCVQRDFYAGVPLRVLNAERPTKSDYDPYFVGGDENIWDVDSCDPRLPPDPPKICVGCSPNPTCIGCPVEPPVCSADSFDSWVGYVDVDTIVERSVVKKGFDDIVAFLISYGVPVFRIGGNVPLPQHGVLLTQKLKAGENFMKVPLASTTDYAGFQFEWGCFKEKAPPPIELTKENLHSFEFLDTGWGNF